jgi:predicted anti-sigma-YlaC factor YlaD
MHLRGKEAKTVDTKPLSLCEQIRDIWEAVCRLSKELKALAQKQQLLDERLESLESVVQRNRTTKPLSD